MPFGPEISWPNGFRQLDTGSRRLLESGYGPAGYGSGAHGSPGYDSQGYDSPGYGSQGYGQGQYDPGYGTGGYGTAGYASGSDYQQPAMEDYGYGDPGYSDPSYNGPRSAYGGPTSPGGGRAGMAPSGSPGQNTGGYGGFPGYQFPEYRESSHPDDGRQPYADPLTGAAGIYPVTGAQEALPATGPQPIAGSWAARDYAAPATGSGAYPEQWYDHPRLDDPRDGGPRADGSPATDPRLEGMRYDQLHYEEPSVDERGYDEPLDDEAWYEELRRSAPSYPQRSADRPGPDQRPADPRRGDPRVSGYGQQPGYGHQAGYPQPPGYGQQPGYSQPPAPERPYGYGQARHERGGPGPSMSAGPETGPGSPPAFMSGPGGAQQPGPALPPDLAFGDAGYLGAPTAQVGVLTPPATRRLDDTLEDGPLLASASAGQLFAPAVRPGHGLDGPEITSSWPSQPQTDDLDSFEEFWREDDQDGDYPGLFPGDGADDRRDGGARAGRRTGRRRGRSRDHRLWLALLGVLVVAAVAIFGIIKLELPAQSGPTHTFATPARIGTYVRTVDLERQTHLAELRGEVIKMSSGQASGVVSAVYESGNSAAGSTEQIVMLIEGHLAHAAPASSIASFTQKFPGAMLVNPGSLGGKAACVQEGAGTSNPVSMCAWFDNDSFGEIVSPTMSATSLATVMRTVRPSVELVAKK